MFTKHNVRLKKKLRYRQTERVQHQWASTQMAKCRLPAFYLILLLNITNNTSPQSGHSSKNAVRICSLSQRTTKGSWKCRLLVTSSIKGKPAKNRQLRMVAGCPWCTWVVSNTRPKPARHGGLIDGGSVRGRSVKWIQCQTDSDWLKHTGHMISLLWMLLYIVVKKTA